MVAELIMLELLLIWDCKVTLSIVCPICCKASCSNDCFSYVSVPGKQQHCFKPLVLLVCQQYVPCRTCI